MPYATAALQRGLGLDWVDRAEGTKGGDMVRLGCLLGPLLLLVLSASPAGALYQDCQFYFGDDSDVPSELEALLNTDLGLALHVCSVSGQPERTRRQVLSRVFRGSFGACQYTVRSIFPEEDGDGVPTWVYTPPPGREYLAEMRRFMLDSDEGCPRQDDLSYIAVGGISEGVFIALMRFWERLSSPDHFDDVLGRSPPEVRHYGGFESLETAIRSGAGERSELKVRNAYLQDIDSPGKGPQYAIGVYPPPDFPMDGWESWNLAVDLGEDGFRLLSISVGVH